MVGMLGKELLDLRTVKIDLALEGAQHAGAHQRQSALGASQCFPGDELAGTGKDLQALLVSLRAHQSMGMQELLPFAFARRLQDLRRGEGFDEGPGTWKRPIIEG